MGKVLGLNTNLILLGKWPKSSPAVRRTLFPCFSLFLFDCWLTTSLSEIKNLWYRVFLDLKLTKLERGSQQTPYYKNLFEAVSVKWFTQTRECFEGMKHSLFIFVCYSLSSFESG